MEKARLPSPAEHPSIIKHRRELWTQILLPLLVAAAIFLTVIILTTTATFHANGDVERWAAVSAIWIIVPILAVGLLLLIVFIGIIYGLARLLALIPAYTRQAQKFFWRIESYAKRGADQATQPIFLLESIATTIKRFIGIK